MSFPDLDQVLAVYDCVSQYSGKLGYKQAENLQREDKAHIGEEQSGKEPYRGRIGAHFSHSASREDMVEWKKRKGIACYSLSQALSSQSRRLLCRTQRRIWVSPERNHAHCWRVVNNLSLAVSLLP